MKSSIFKIGYLFKVYFFVVVNKYIYVKYKYRILNTFFSSSELKYIKLNSRGVIVILYLVPGS